jgi:hypothetical protein
MKKHVISNNPAFPDAYIISTQGWNNSIEFNINLNEDGDKGALIHTQNGFENEMDAIDAAKIYLGIEP